MATAGERPSSPNDGLTPAQRYEIEAMRVLSICEWIADDERRREAEIDRASDRERDHRR
jgi:hypothetical protein